MLAKQRAGQRAGVERAAKTTQTEEDLRTGAKLPDEEIETLADSEGDALPEAGVDVDALAAEGADALGGDIAIATIAVTIGVTRAITVITDAEIPGQLQGDLNAAQTADPATDVADLLNDPTGAGYLINWTNFENQLDLPGITVGNPPSPTCLSSAVYASPPAAPAGQADELGNGPQPRRDAVVVVVDGIDHPQHRHLAPRGERRPRGRVPQVTGPAWADGMAWTQQQAGQPATDETSDGLTGFLPSGELRYFDAAGASPDRLHRRQPVRHADLQRLHRRGGRRRR